MVIAKYRKKKWILMGTLKEAMDKVESQVKDTKYSRTHNLLIDEDGVPIIFIPISLGDFRKFYK